MYLVQLKEPVYDTLAFVDFHIRLPPPRGRSPPRARKLGERVVVHIVDATADGIHEGRRYEPKACLGEGET